MNNENLVDIIARTAYEANRGYSRLLGDFSHQTDWDNAPNWQRESTKAGVRSALANLDMTSREGHEKWLEYKRKEGWTYGPEKDAERKTHPCFLPYDELPEEQRIKDGIFLGVVQALAVALSPLAGP